MSGVFVTGTDTGIGKTLVSAWLVRSWGGEYWKPVQSGTDEGWDAATVARLAPGTVIHPSAYALRAPLSPDQAAERQGVVIDLDAFRLPRHDRPLVVEGAGGVLVPLNERARMIDLMARLGLPVVVVGRSGLGTINHTLLTLEALARHGLEIAGVILSGPPDAANAAAITRFSGCRLLAELPLLPSDTALADLPPVAWSPQA